MMKILKAHCNNCLGERRHEVLFSETTTDTEDLGRGCIIYDENVYQMLKCAGCENIILMHRNTFSEDRDENGRPYSTIKYYPPAVSRKKPRWLNDLFWVEGFENNVISDLIIEIYYALQNDSRRLASMGIRALLEHIMIDKVGDNGTFTSNLIKFQKDGFISELQRKNLDTIFEAGHASIHRAFKPSKEDLITLVDIAESIVESIYIHEVKTKRLLKNIPARKRKGSEIEKSVAE